MSYAPHLLNAFMSSVLLVIALQHLPVPIKPVDRPVGRKTHIGLVPLTGGVAMFIAFLVALWLLGRSLFDQIGLLVGLLVLVVVGTVDDLCDLRPLTKLVVQCAAALVMVLPHWRVLDDLGVLTEAAPLRLGILALPVTLLFVVGLINAINMIDGVDGLAGGVVGMALLWLALIASSIGRQDEIAVILLLFAAIAGFLFFNLRTPWRHRASVFMGDAGSMMLGACLAYFVLSVATSPEPEDGIGQSASLPALCWLLALPVIDTLSLSVRRILAGGSPFAADRRHLHHLLLDMGLSSGQVTALLIAVSAGLGGIGFAGIVFKVPDPVMALGLLLPLAVHTACVCHRPTKAVAPAPSVGASSLPGVAARTVPGFDAAGD